MNALFNFDIFPRIPKGTETNSEHSDNEDTHIPQSPQNALQNFLEHKNKLKMGTIIDYIDELSQDPSDEQPRFIEYLEDANTFRCPLTRAPSKKPISK